MSGYGVEVGPTYTTFTPRTPRTGKRGVILCHGAGSAGEWLDATNQTASVILAARLASEGFTCITGAFGGDTWGNATGVTAVGSAFTALQATGCASDKFCGIGVSMGHALLSAYAEQNPSKVAAGVGIIPVSDVNGMYQANTGGYRASIAAAGGVTYPAALPTGMDNLSHASALAGIPWRLYYSTADTVILPSTVTAFAAASGATATAVSSTLDHSDAAVQKAVDLIAPDGAASNLIQLLIANGA